MCCAYNGIPKGLCCADSQSSSAGMSFSCPQHSALLLRAIFLNIRFSLIQSVILLLTFPGTSRKYVT